MSIITFVWNVVQNLPEIISVISSVVRLIHRVGADKAESPEHLEESKAKLSVLHDSLCSGGVGCPSDLVK